TGYAVAGHTAPRLESEDYAFLGACVAASPAIPTELFVTGERADGSQVGLYRIGNLTAQGHVQATSTVTPLVEEARVVGGATVQYGPCVFAEGAAPRVLYTK